MNELYFTSIKRLVFTALVTSAGAFFLPGTSYAAGDPAVAGWLKEHKISHRTTADDADAKVVWISGEKLVVDGKGFKDTATTWSRLPKKYRGKVTNGVWSAGTNPSGIALRFVTDSPVIKAKWDAPRHSMNHMARSGSNGLDLYAWEGGKWSYAGTGIPATTGTSMAQIYPKAYSTLKVDLSKPGPVREYMLFLPTYSTLRQINIGIDPKFSIAAGSDRNKDKKPIVFYGTSISQGGCAPRSGLGHIERLRRWLDYPTINMGFSGSGKCERIMANLLAEIPAVLYVIETVPNMDDELVKTRTVPFLKKLHKMQPDTPILMVESPNVGLNSDRNLLWHEQYEKAKASGTKNLYYLAGADLYGGVDDPTVDGVHATDLGFYQMAKHYEPVLRKILNLPAHD